MDWMKLKVTWFKLKPNLAPVVHCTAIATVPNQKTDRRKGGLQEDSDTGPDPIRCG